MTYSAGGLIEATDYNGFVNVSANNINAIWSTGSGDKGWGQTALATVSTGATVTATSWASLVNTLATAGNQTTSTLTSRTAPVTGNTVSILANVATDINTVTLNRGYAFNTGTTSSTFTGTTSKTTTTGAGNTAWTITFTHTVTFPSADQARYFWNAGGTVRLDMSKTSTGLDSDADWNTFIGTMGTFTMAGRINNANTVVGGVIRTGFQRDLGSGTPTTLLTTTGWYSLTGGAAATTMFLMSNATAPYTNDNVQITAAVNAARTTLTFVTTWNAGARTGAGQNTQISGGTATTSPYSAFGTAPTVLCRFTPPSTTYLTDSWGTPTIAASVA